MLWGMFVAEILVRLLTIQLLIQHKKKKNVVLVFQTTLGLDLVCLSLAFYF